MCDAALCCPELMAVKLTEYLTKLIFCCLLARFQFHASPLRKFLESQKLSRNVFCKLEVSVADRKTKKASKRKTNIHLESSGLGGRGGQKEQRAQSKPCPKRQTMISKYFERRGGIGMPTGSEKHSEGSHGADVTRRRRRSTREGRGDTSFSDAFQCSGGQSDSNFRFPSTLTESRNEIVYTGFSAVPPIPPKNPSTYLWLGMGSFTGHTYHLILLI